MFQGNSSGSPAGGDFVSQLRAWFESCPVFTKGLIYICTTFAILNALSGFSVLLVNIPAYTIGYFQIYRLLFSPVAFTSVFQLLFGFLAYLPMSAKQERAWGTTKTIVDFLWKNLLINMAFICFTYILSILFSNATQLPCYGLWQIFFVQLVERCMENPEGISMLLCLPIQIKTKYYPVALFLLFSLISQTIRFDNLIAILVGYVHYKYINIHYLPFINNTRISAWEDSFLFAWLKGMPNHVGCSSVGSSSSNAGTTIGRPSANTENTNNQPAASQFNAFKGKGITLGESDENTNTGKTNSTKKDNYVQLNDDTQDLEEGNSNNQSQ